MNVNDECKWRRQIQVNTGVVSFYWKITKLFWNCFITLTKMSGNFIILKNNSNDAFDLESYEKWWKKV